MDYEDKLDLASRKVQRIYRSKKAREVLKKLVRNNYVKIYDKVGDRFVYKNRSSGVISDTKPRFLGNDDLITPRLFEAPLDYNPGDTAGEVGHCLLITVTNFPLSSKLQSDMPSAPNADHKFLEELLSHDFLCRFPLENVSALKNPTRAEFKDALDLLRRTLTKKTFLVVYICTHIMQISTKDKATKKEDTYLAMSDTRWDKLPENTARSSVSLGDLINFLNRILCERKVVLLNHALAKPPVKHFFKNKKILYPPVNILNRLSNGANCAVIASCAVGTPMKDLLSQTPPSEEIVKKVENTIIKSEQDKLELLKTKAANNDNDIYHLSNINNSNITSLIKISKSLFSQTHSKVNTNENENEMTLKFLEKELEMQYREDLQLPPEISVVTSDRPPDPHPTWKRNETTGFEIKIDMPTEDDYRKYDRKVAFWRIRRAFGRPLNAMKIAKRYYQRRNLCAPEQSSSISDRQTLFSKAIIEALSGPTSSPENPIITAEVLFAHLRLNIKKLLALQINTPSTSEVTNKTDKHENNFHNQTPILIVPNKNKSAAKFPICFKCTPPPAPEVPFVIRVGFSEVQLEWYDTPFAGSPPFKYQVFMKNISRNFSKWNQIEYPGDIWKKNFLVRNLPAGVACQFAVRSYNNGGWSELSQATLFVCPGEDRAPISSALRWKKLKMGGALAIVDRMQLYPFHRFDQMKGLRYLSMLGQNQSGFTKSNIAIKVSVATIHAMKTFAHDREISASAFLVLGWCMRGPADRKVRNICNQNGVVDIAIDCMERFRFDTSVINSITWLRAVMPKHIPQPPVIVVPEEKKRIEGDGDGNSSEEEDELETAK